MPNMDQMCVRGMHAYAFAVTLWPTTQAPPGRVHPARCSLGATQGFPCGQSRALGNKCQRMRCMREMRGDAMCARRFDAGDPGDGDSGRGSALTHCGRRAVAVGGKSGARCGPPARVRSGRLGCPRLPGARNALRRRKRNPYACGSAVGECIRARDGKDARPAQW